MHVILNVYMCVDFGDEILLRGEECKTREKKSIFLKNGKTVICRYNTGGKSENFLDLR